MEELGRVRCAIITFAPAARNRSVIPRPIPRPPPVTIATLPDSNPMICLLFRLGRRGAADAWRGARASFAATLP